MENRVKVNSMALPYIESKVQIIKPSDFDIDILGFRKYNQNNWSVLTLRSNIIEKDNYKISLQKNHLAILFSEIKEIEQPIYLHNYDWNVLKEHAYEKLRSLIVLLPSENYHLIKYFAIAEKKLLKIVLGEPYSVSAFKLN